MMKVKDLFNVGEPPQAVVGTREFLNSTNCTVVNKTKQEEAVLLKVKRDQDGMEGNAYLRVLPQYREVAEQLVNWGFADGRMIGLTLNDIRYLDTNIEITSLGGRMMFSQNT